MPSNSAGLSTVVSTAVEEIAVAGRVFAAPLYAIDGAAIDGVDGDPCRFTATRIIDAADPHLAAHFPSFTIFPGVFIIESLRQAVAAVAGPDTGITAVRSARFLAPLLPGDELTLRATLTPTANGGHVVDAQALRRDGTVAAQMKIDVGASADDHAPDHARVRTFLPHAHPMLLVDRIVALEPGVSITAIKAVTSTEPCYRALPPDLAPGRYAYPTSLMLESFGQTAAILWRESADAAQRGADDIIILAAMRNCRIEGHAYPGDVLRHVARLDNVVGDTVLVEGETWVGDRRVATIGTMIAAVRPAASVREPALATTASRMDAARA